MKNIFYKTIKLGKAVLEEIKFPSAEKKKMIIVDKTMTFLVQKG